MKKINLILLASLLLVSSCNDLFLAFEDYGISVRVRNRSSSDIEWSKVYIGKYDNNTFYPTDSVIGNVVIPMDSTVNLTPESEYKMGWWPHQNKLNTGRSGFFLKLSDGREHYFGEFTGSYKTGSSVHVSVYDDKIYPPTD